MIIPNCWRRKATQLKKYRDQRKGIKSVCDTFKNVVEAFSPARKEWNIT